MAEKPYDPTSWHKNVVDNIKQANPELSNYPNKNIFEGWVAWYLSDENEEQIKEYIILDDENNVI